MPADDPPFLVAEEHAPGWLAERAWWTRVKRAAVGRDQVMADWSHDMLQVLGAEPDQLTELVPGVGWQAPPPAHCTDEYKQRETRRLKDELGVRLGVGPMP